MKPCHTLTPLNPRCVTCEYKRSVANEQEGELLRQEIEALKLDVQKLQKDLS
jgi:hypothetical protein